MATDTRERILEAALEMFAENGYKGTNLRDLASTLNISKSALYRHFDSKEKIWNALISSLEEYYSKRMGSGGNIPKIPDSVSELREMTLKMAEVKINDPKIRLVRKVLVMEQFKDESTADLMSRHTISSIVDIFTKVFAGMIEKGLIKSYDPYMMAFSFATPISTLVHLCDREPDRKEEAMKRIEEFTNHFIKVYETEK